jgi:hypothetical protein
MTHLWKQGAKPCVWQKEGVSFFSLGTGPLAVTKDQMIVTQFKEIVIAKLKSPLGIESGHGEPRSQAHPPEEIYKITEKCL